MTHMAWRRRVIEWDPRFYDWYFLTKFPGA